METSSLKDDWLETPFDLSGKKVWIAGASGMVGSALVRRLQTENCDILTASHKELDLRNQAATQHWINQNKPDVILIAAAKVGGILANATYPADFLYDNLMIEANIIHAAHETGVEKLVFLGSSCIYPKEAPQPITEDALLTGPLEPTNEPYALAKIAGIKLCQSYRTQHDADFISLMPCNLYGPGDSYNENNSHVIPALIMKAHAAKESGASEMSIWGSGTPLREFLYVDDLADATIFALKHYSADKPLNIGSGKELSIRDLTTLICETVGFNGALSFDSSKPDGAMRKLLDSARITKAGWQPQTSLKDGLQTAYADYCNRFVT